MIPPIVAFACSSTVFFFLGVAIGLGSTVKDRRWMSWVIRNSDAPAHIKRHAAEITP